MFDNKRDGYNQQNNHVLPISLYDKLKTNVYGL